MNQGSGRFAKVAGLPAALSSAGRRRLCGSPCGSSTFMARTSSGALLAPRRPDKLHEPKGARYWRAPEGHRAPGALPLSCSARVAPTSSASFSSKASSSTDTCGSPLTTALHCNAPIGASTANKARKTELRSTTAASLIAPDKRCHIQRLICSAGSAQMPTTISRFLSTKTAAAAAAETASEPSGDRQPAVPKDESATALDPSGVKRIKVNACGRLYTELAKTVPHLYAKAPQEKGIDFDLEYYDSEELREAPQQEAPLTVCLLHGAPGHYSDFSLLIKALASKGLRVLAPSFPDYSATFRHSFRHSPRERADLLKEFFDALRVTKVDMLIGHSSAVYTMFELLEQSLNSNSNSESSCDLLVKSLGLFSTPSYNLSSNLAATPYRLFTLKLFDYPILRPLLLALIHTFVRLQGIRNRVDKDKIENLLIAASAVGYSGSENMKARLKLIHRFNIPTFVLFGCQDRLIPMSCFEQLMRDLRVDQHDERQVKRYDKNGRLMSLECAPGSTHQNGEQPGGGGGGGGGSQESDATGGDNTRRLVHVSQFSSAGHYAFQRYPKQVEQDLLEFLRSHCARDAAIKLD